MSERFEILEERLLRGGIAPRRVSRYLRELGDHLSDITDAQRASGLDAATAAVRARTALGADDELAHALLKRNDFRSLAARFPWLVFGVFPVLVLSAVLPWHFLLLVVMEQFSAPALLATLAELALLTGNYILVPAIVSLFVVMARRQRLSLAWPILSAAVVLFLSPHWDNQSGAGVPPGFSALHVLYRESGVAIRSGITPLFLGAWREQIALHWAAFAAQYLLTLLPLAWLVRRDGRASATA